MLTNNFIKWAVIVADFFALGLGLFETVHGYHLMAVITWALGIALFWFWAKHELNQKKNNRPNYVLFLEKLERGRFNKES